MPQLVIEEFGLMHLLRPEILSDPYPVFRRLRLEAPVCEDPTGLGWIVSRYDDIAFVLSDRRFSAERILSNRSAQKPANPVETALARQMLFLDPPDHTRLRGLFTKAFTPNRIEGLRPEIHLIVTELLDAAEERGAPLDFIRDFAVPLPVTVIARMLGVPAGDQDSLKDWSVAFGKLIDGRTLSEIESREAQLGVLAFMGYFRELIEQRRKRPANDMLTDLISAEEKSDRLSTEELIVNLLLLLAAGHGTTTRLLGNGLVALLQNPIQWQLLSNEPTLAAGAVNELLRFDGPVQATMRETVEDVQIGSVMIASAQRVTVLLGSVNRDQEHFADPDSLDLRRAGARMLSFGHGIHSCLGAALARLEAQVAFVELSRRFSSCSLAAAPERAVSVSFRGFQSLSVMLKSS